MTGDHEEIEISAGADNVTLHAKGGAAARLSNSIADALSPFTGGLGALGDVIHYYRQDMALKAINKSLQLSKTLRIPIKPVPPKFLVQWVEQVSLEDPADTDITDMWAGLLLSAGNSHHPGMYHYKRILSEMTANHLQLLSLLCDIDFSSVDPYSPTSDYTEWNKINLYASDNKLHLENTDYYLFSIADKANNNRLKINYFNIKSYVRFMQDEITELYKINTSVGNFQRNHILKYFKDVGIIEEIGISAPVECAAFNSDRSYHLQVNAIHLSQFGCDFISACRPSPIVNNPNDSAAHESP